MFSQLLTSWIEQPIFLMLAFKLFFWRTQNRHSCWPRPGLFLQLFCYAFPGLSYQKKTGLIRSGWTNGFTFPFSQLWFFFGAGFCLTQQRTRTSRFCKYFFTVVYMGLPWNLCRNILYRIAHLMWKTCWPMRSEVHSDGWHQSKCL